MNRILMVYDVDGWAWHGMARGIQKHAPSDFDVTITSEKRCPSRRRLSAYDAVFWFSWTCCPLHIKPFCRRLWTVNAHHGCMYDHNPDAKWTPDVAAAGDRCLSKAKERLPQFSGIIAKNRSLNEFTRQLNEHTVYVPSGVEIEHWRPAPVSQEGPLRVAWCGQNRQANPWQNTKGYMQVLLPLLERLKNHPGIVFRTNNATYRDGVLSSAEMVNWYQQADVFLCTSSTEGAPLPVFEAAACGRPVISTSVGAVPELVTDGENGFLLGLFTSQAEARAVVDLAEQRIFELAADRGRLASMSRAIREKVESCFSWKHLAKDWLRALMTVPEQQPAQSNGWPSRIWRCMARGRAA